jgi:hypothetical protein
MPCTGKAVLCRGRTRARARVWLEVGDDPDRWALAVSERKKGRRKLARGRAVGPGRKCGAGRWTGPHVGGKKRKKGQLGWALWGGKGEKRGWLGLDRVEEKGEEKEKERVGRAKKKKREKKNCIQIHLNLNLKFKFKWKTNNKTMQCGMKCTRTIIPYISF